MASTNILGICGSLRKGSFNRKLLNEAVRLFGPCDFEEILLDLPLYNGDSETEQGRPKEVEDLALAIKNADAVIVTSPEYNKGISGVLKNALDWVSRVPGGVWKDKPVAILSAAGGRTGGETAQYMLRHCFTPFGASVLTSPVVCIASASEQFDENNHFLLDRYQISVQKLMQNLAQEIELQKRYSTKG